MHKKSVPLLLATLLLGPGLAGCEKFQARAHFKQGNSLYREENYHAAISEYQRGLAIDPSATLVWRSVGLASLALYRPGDESAQNMGYARTALQAFENYSKSFPDDPKPEEYIITTLIGMKRWDEAITRIRAKGAGKPEKAAEVDGAVFGILLKANRLEDAYAHALKGVPRPDPTKLYTIGVNCWDKAYRDPSLDKDARGKVVDMGMKALVQADQIKPQDFQTMVYINLMFREKAKLEPDPYVAQTLYEQAQQWFDKAKAARAREQAASGKPAAS